MFTCDHARLDTPFRMRFPPSLEVITTANPQRSAARVVRPVLPVTEQSGRLLPPYKYTQVEIAELGEAPPPRLTVAQALGLMLRLEAGGQRVVLNHDGTIGVDPTAESRLTRARVWFARLKKVMRP